MRRVATLLGGLLVAAVLQTGTASAGPAPCTSHKQDRVDIWGNTTTWTSSIQDARGIRVVANTYFTFCPNGRRHNKVMPYKVQYCWTHTNGRAGGIPFDGVVFDTGYFDDNKQFSPWALTVPDNGEDQNCKTRHITDNTRRWLVLVHSAGWTADYKIRKVASPDTWKAFKWDNNPWKYFQPWLDWAVSGWYP